MKKSILDVLHESAKGLHEAGLLDIETMHTFDAMCLTPIKELSPKEIRRIRLRERVSQPSFCCVFEY